MATDEYMGTVSCKRGLHKYSHTAIVMDVGSRAPPPKQSGTRLGVVSGVLYGDSPVQLLWLRQRA